MGHFGTWVSPNFYMKISIQIISTFDLAFEIKKILWFGQKVQWIKQIMEKKNMVLDILNMKLNMLKISSICKLPNYTKNKKYFSFIVYESCPIFCDFIKNNIRAITIIILKVTK